MQASRDRPTPRRDPRPGLRLGVTGLTALAGALAQAGCSDAGRSDESLGHLVIAPDDQPAAIDVDRASRDPAELGRAAALPHSRVGALLGPHRFRGKSSLVVLEGGRQVESLDVQTEVDLAEGGAYHAVLDNSADYGREVFFVNNTMYLRPKHGRFHARAPTAEAEPAEVRDAIAGDVGAYLELLLPGVDVTDQGAETVAGRAGRKLAISRAARQRKRPAEPSHRKWRESAQVQAAEGEIVLDADTGAALRASVQGEVTAVRDDVPVTLKISASHEISAIGGDVAVTPPPPGETVPTPERTREVEERDRLLRGIAPPTRRDRAAGAGGG